MSDLIEKLNMQDRIAELEKQCEALADNCMRHGEYIYKLEAEVEMLREALGEKDDE